MTTWVLLRGLTREAGHWGAFPIELAARLGPEHQVIALDLPGNGELHGRRSPANVPAMAYAAREEAGRRGLRGPFVLMAMSLGAMVALDWAAAAPHELAGGVLINTSLRGLSPFWHRLRPRNWLRLLHIASAASQGYREWQVLRMTSGNPARHAHAARRWEELARRHPVSAANALRQLWAASRYEAPARRPAVPLLLLSAARDGLVSPQCSRRLAAHWQLPLLTHPEAGHDLPLDDPQWVIDQASAWWQGRGARGELKGS